MERIEDDEEDSLSFLRGFSALSLPFAAGEVDTFSLYLCIRCKAMTGSSIWIENYTRYLWHLKKFKIKALKTYIFMFIYLNIN